MFVDSTAHRDPVDSMQFLWPVSFFSVCFTEHSCSIDLRYILELDFKKRKLSSVLTESLSAQYNCTARVYVIPRKKQLTEK